MATFQRAFVAAMLVVFTGSPLAGADERNAAPGFPWYEGNAHTGHKVCLYVFIDPDCPSCPAAKAFANDLKRQSWCKVLVYDITKTSANLKLFNKMANGLGVTADVVPAMFYCNSTRHGFMSYEDSGKPIEDEMKRWSSLLKERE